MITITATSKNGMTLLDVNLVKNTLRRFNITFTNSKVGYDYFKFDVDKSIINTNDFYKTYLVLHTVYDIELKHPDILTAESMLEILANNYLQE